MILNMSTDTAVMIWKAVEKFFRSFENEFFINKTSFLTDYGSGFFRGRRIAKFRVFFRFACQSPWFSVSVFAIVVVIVLGQLQKMSWILVSVYQCIIFS